MNSSRFKHEIRIVALWLAVMALIRMTFFFDHQYIYDAGFLNLGLQILLLLLSVIIAKNSQGNQRYVFVNFSIVFGFTIALFLNVFIGEGGSIFPSSKYGNMLYHIYVNKFGLNWIHVFAVVYLAIDYFRVNLSIKRKYALAAGSSLLIVSMFFLPFLAHPFSLYDAKEFSELNRVAAVHEELVTSLKSEPNIEQLVNGVERESRIDGADFAGVNHHETQNVVSALAPYLKPGGNTTIFWKPLDQLSIYVNCIILGIIFTVLTFLYKQNKPVGSYIDKILLILLIFFFLEILHTYGSMQSDSFEQYKVIFEIGQYATIMNLLLLVYAFDLKRRFVCSAAGKYYERVIQESPETITRWRDELDTYILKSFFRKNEFTKQLGHSSKFNNNVQTGTQHES